MYKSRQKIFSEMDKATFIACAVIFQIETETKPIVSQYYGQVQP
jgi:hypothetical protein